MKLQALSSSEREAVLRRAIIRAVPEYYTWPKAKQEEYRLNTPREEDFRIRQALLGTFFDIQTNSEEELNEALDNFDDDQYLLLNSTLLPFQGIGENNFFLNECLADGVTLLDFDTLGDYARDDHHFQQRANKQEDRTYETQPYRGNLYPCWARLNIDGEFNYATLFSLVGQLRGVMDETGTERINELIPHDYVEGKNHGKREQHGTIFELKVNASGREPQLDELQHRYYKYMHTRYEHMLERFDQAAEKQVYILPQKKNHEPHIDFVFSDKCAMDAVRFQHFYRDCRRIAGNCTELDALAEQERLEAVEFLDKNYRDILDNFDPSVVRLRKKKKIIVADGAWNDFCR